MCGDSGMGPTCVLSARQGVLFGQAARDQAEGNGSSKDTYGHLLSRGATADLGSYVDTVTQISFPLPTQQQTPDLLLSEADAGRSPRSAVGPGTLCILCWVGLMLCSALLFLCLLRENSSSC